MTAPGKVSKSRPGSDKARLKDALEFAALMDAAMAFGKWKGAALLGVHAAMAAGDAVCSKHLEHHSSSHRHDDAAALLRTVDIPGARDKADLLGQILSAKSAAAYEGRPFEEQDAQVLAKRVHRLVEWARTIVAP
jgi:hypothetical protein